MKVLFEQRKNKADTDQCYGVNEQRLQEGGLCVQGPSCPLPVASVLGTLHRA